MFAHFINIYLKLFVILTPFFVISAFLSMTGDFTAQERQKTAVKVTVAVIISCFTLYLFGRHIFDLFGITLDAFRIGAGAVLFLSAINMIQGNTTIAPSDKEKEVAVVPLAIPITVGPGTIGALLVMGAGQTAISERLVSCLALLSAVLTVGAMLLLAGRLERVIGNPGLTILTKLTGLFVSAIAAQIFFTGLRNFLG